MAEAPRQVGEAPMEVDSSSAPTIAQPNPSTGVSETSSSISPVASSNHSNVDVTPANPPSVPAAMPGNGLPTQAPAMPLQQQTTPIISTNPTLQPSATQPASGVTGTMSDIPQTTAAPVAVVDSQNAPANANQMEIEESSKPKWAETTAQINAADAIAAARAYAEAHAEVVVPRKRGRPRKYPVEGEGAASPPPAPVPKRISIPKPRPTPKPKKTKKKKRRDDDDLTDSENEFIPESISRRSERPGIKKPGFFSDGDVDTEDEEEYPALPIQTDEDVAHRIANQRVSLRQRKRLNYAEQFRDDEETDEDDIIVKKKPAKKAGRPRAASMGDLAAAAAAEEEDDFEDEEEDLSKPDKSGLAADWVYKSTQIERILAYREKPTATPIHHPHHPSHPAPKSLAGPIPPPPGSAAALAAAARAAGTLEEIPMEILAHRFANPPPAAAAAAATTEAAATDAAQTDAPKTDATEGSAEKTDAMETTPSTAPALPPVLASLPPPPPSRSTISLESHPALTPGTQYEFLVKYKQRSFIHCEWLPQFVVERAKLGKQRLQRFLNKRPELDPDLPFDPEYTEVDRILAREERDGKTYYYVKWQGLPYNESTWESSDEVNDAHAVAEFERHNEVPAIKQDATAPTVRPPASEWKEKPNLEFKDGNQLRAYQREGMNWLRFCWYNRRNSILADEMGLGKTVQTVSILWYLYHYHNIRGPFMIIAPLSTIPHWRRELEAWTDMNCLVYHGNSEARQIIRDFEWHYLDENGVPKFRNMFKFNVLVTTYEMILTDSDILRPIRWKYIAIDEAHRLKNKASRVLNEFLNFKYDHLLLLTGTPIQNNTQELWTLLNLLDPVQFNSAEDFVAAFGNLKDAEQVKRLHDILKPFLLRRMKEDVEKSIAPKEETIIEVELTTIQKKYYRAVLERSFDNLVQGSKSRSALPSLLNIMMQLRKCCNHPYLLKGVEETELGIQSQQTETNETLIESSGKLVLIDKLLPRLKAEGHKILIFSQMVRVLDILEDYLNYRNYKHERIDGAVRGNDRQSAIDRFSKPDSDIFVFLLCTRAGGVGINLTAADTVIIFDSDWNPQNDIQAQARCHRIGQQKSVQVYRLLTRGTYERVMFERASLKLGLDQAVLSRMSDTGADEDGGKPKFTSSEVDSLLKHGAYDLFRDDDTSSERFREANIEDILSQRTTRVVHDQSAQVGSTFSKASFASDQANTDLDVNDPDFWKKVMPNQAFKPDPNILIEPRQRRPVQRVEHHHNLDSDSELGSYSDEDDGAHESDDELFQDFEGDRRREGYMGPRERGTKEKGERTRKPSGPILQKRKWNMTQRNRFVRAIQLVGFGRWREIKRNAKLANKSLKEIACYGRAFLRKLIGFAGLAEGDTEEKLIARIINCDDGIEDLTEEPWRSTSKRQMTAYNIHKQESEAGVPAEMIKAAEERYAKSVAQHEAIKAKEEAFIQRKLAQIKEGKLDEIQKELDRGFEMGGYGPTAAASISPDVAPEELPVTPDDPIVIHWHLNDPEEVAQEVSYFCDEDPMMNDPRFLDNTKATATQTIKRFELLAEVGALVRTNFSEFSDEAFPKIEGGDTTFFHDKWTVCHDRDLLVGTWKWGFGQYDKMVRDPLLSYYGFYKPKPLKERIKGEDDDDDGDDDAGDDDEEEGAKKKTPKKTGMKRTSSKKTMSVTATEPVKTEETKMEVESAAPSSDSAPAAQGANSMEVDVKPVVKTEGAADEGSALLDMPPSKLLTHRVKHLLKAFFATRKKRNQSEQKEKKRLEKEKEKEEKHRRRVDKETSWSKRERSDFVRTLLTHGIPYSGVSAAGVPIENWELLHSKSKLVNKSVQAFERYFKEFIIVCKYLVGSARPRRKKEGEDGDESLGDPGLLGGLTEAQLDAKADELHLTATQAKRVYERLNFFSALRLSVLKTNPAELEAKLSKATTAGYGLPGWWVVPKFDLALLKGVDAHGFGRWEPLFTDPSLPFMEVAKANLGIDITKTKAEQKAKEEEDDDEEKDNGDEETKDLYASLMPAEKMVWKRLLYLVYLTTNNTGVDPSAALAVSNPGGGARLVLKKKQPTLTAFAGAAEDPIEDDDENGTASRNKKRRRELSINEGADPSPKRTRSTPFDDVKIEYDAAGQIIYPIVITGVLTIESLGTISDLPAFHSEKYIWPIGFVSKREYLSSINPEGRTKYKCEILASPDGSSPIFRVTPEDEPNAVCEASSASQAWKLVLDRINKSRPDTTKRSSVSGPEYFGFGHPKIAELIAKLPNAEKCVKYHAAQTPVINIKRKKRDRADASRRSGKDDDSMEMDESEEDIEEEESASKRRKLAKDEE